MRRLALTLALGLAACDDPPPPKVHFTPMKAPDAGPPPELDAGPPPAPDAGYVFRAPHRPPRPITEALYRPYMAYAYAALAQRQPLADQLRAFGQAQPPGDPRVAQLGRDLADRWAVLHDQLLVQYDLTDEEVERMEHFANDVNRAAVIEHELAIDVAGRAEFDAMPKALHDSLRQHERANNQAIRDLKLWPKIEATYGPGTQALGKKHQADLKQLTNDTALSSAGITPPDVKRPRLPR